MKTKYLEKLRDQLQNFQASKADIDEILSDYGQLYDDALAKGKTDEEIYQLLGEPRQVAYELIDTIKIKQHKNKRNKIIALMPFISVIIFMILGFGWDLWHPGWMVFLLIPITAIIMTTDVKNAIIALSPFITTLTYLLLGFKYDLWHPGWLIFFFIPMISIILNTRLKDMFVALSPFVATIAFMILGTYYDLWNPGWLVFLIIPMLGILHMRSLWKLLVSELAFIVAIAFYLYMGYVQNNWATGGLGFILPVATSIIFGDMNFVWDMPKGPMRKKVYILLSSIALSIAVFVLLGVLAQGWAYAWQIFLIIPVASIILFDKFRVTAIMPFIAVVLFFSLGYFLHIFQWSWLAFLLIPMAAIIENA